MPSAEDFYYQLKSGEALYGVEPHGQLNVNKMLRSKPCWKKLTSLSQPHQKTLILADWRSMYWSEEQIDTIKKILHRLIDEGFTLYHRQDNSFKALTKTNLNSLSKSYTESSLLVPNELIRQASRQLDLPAEQIHVVDDYWLHLLKNSDIQPVTRFIEATDFQKYIAHDYLIQAKKKVLEILKQAKPPLGLIVHNEFSKVANLTCLELSRSIPGATVSSAYQILRLNSGWANTLLEKGYLTSNGYTFTTNDLHTIETLEINDPNISSDALKKLLMQMPKLKVLHLSQFKDLSADFTQDLDLPHLEALDISNSSISSQSVQKLLTNTPKLKVLNLSSCNNLTEDFTQNLDLSVLETLNLFQSSISGKSLQKVLVNTPKLKTLDIAYCNNLTDDFIENLDLPFLETLTGYCSSISSQSLQKLLAKTPNLKTLDLSNCRNLKDDFIENLDLPLLETLCIYGSSISSLSLQKLLAKAPSLKTLNLANCKNLTDDFIENLDLPLLETLSLVSLSISSQSLQKLLAKTPQLKTINFTSCKNLGEDFTQNLGVLSSIESLNFMYSSISSLSLQKLIAKTPKLKILKLNYCKNLTEDFTQDLDLSFLEVLDVHDSCISSKSLQKLLAKIPKLKDLHLSKYEHLTDDFTQNLDLSSLVSLDLYQTLISTPSLQNLLNKTPNLKNLDLSSCTHLTGEFTQSLDLSALETLKIGNSSISRLSLQKLLAKTTGLKKLSLSGFDYLNADLVQNLDLSSVTTLDLSYSYVDTLSLQRLLAKTPSLKELKLYAGKFPTVDFRNLDLSSIETIDLYTSSINTLQLQTLLSKTPKLKVLDLTGCRNLTDDFTENLDLSSIEHLKLTHSSLSSKSIEKLLSCMPNLKYLELTNDIKINKQLKDELFARIVDIKIYSGEMHSTSEIPRADPVHIPKDLKDFKPTSDDFKFQFKGENKSLNQGMIIEKLSHYLTLTQQHQALIPRLQDGICNGLTHMFLDHPLLGEWLKLIGDWNGHSDTHPVLDPIFKLLIEYIKKYQLEYLHEKRTYLGDNLVSFLDTCPSSVLLGNPWHAVAVKFEPQNNQWIVYDPNFFQGPKSCSSKEELLHILRQSLGNLIDVVGSYPVSVPEIQHPSDFIRDGGLLVLCHQFDNCNALLSQLPPAKNLSSEALEGLVLRDLKGVPAWAKMLKNPLTVSYALNLLEAFAKYYPHEYESRLDHSMDALSTYERHEYLACLTGLSSNKSTVFTLSDVLRNTTSKKEYDHALQTWDREQSDSPFPLALCQQLVQGEQKCTLLELDGTNSVQSMQLLLEQYCHTTSRPVFYIDSPEDLVCSAPFIKKEGVYGRLFPGPGGRLHDFLQKHQQSKPAPVILVNYDNFEADDVVRFNQLLDKTPNADGTPLPPSAQVIGLINPLKPSAYQGEDFYSRFDAVITCPFTGSRLAKEQAPLPFIDAEGGQPSTLINLYHSSDWEERLLGKWVIQKDQLIFQEGELQAAVKSGLPIEIHNGLWEDPKFNQFWQHAFLRGYIEHEGEHIIIPKTLQLIQKKGYDWKNLASHVSFTTKANPTAEVINPSRLSEMFQQYHCDNATKTLDTVPGLLLSQANKNLEIHVTRSLNENEWAMILDASRKNRLHLTCHCASSVELPAPLQHLVTDKPLETLLPPWNKSNNASTLVIDSSDPDTTIDLLIKDEKDWLVIDVSECQGSDLLMQIRGGLNPHGLNFEFNQSTNALLTALGKKQKVILKGHFSAELCDALAPLLLQRHGGTHYEGQLVLVSQDTNDLGYLPRHAHQVNGQEKKAILAQSFNKEMKALDKELFEHESLSQLKARCRYMRINPNAVSTDAAWQGMYHLPGGIRLDEFDAEHSAEIARAFNKKRLDAVNQVLAHAPYVFLTGLTGVGKSTFVEKYLDTSGTQLYQGVSQIRQWAQDSSDKQKILFLDEANLSEREWSEFEGLFNNPPGILIDNHYPLTEKHKVVFASNPLNYGDERKLAPFFERHGNALVFDPMPQEFIYEEILKPIFAKTPLESSTLNLCLPMLQVYRFICECSKDKVLISPRELQMMALLTLSYAHQNTTQKDSVLAAQYYAYQLGRNLVPEEKRASFDSQFKTNELPQRSRPKSEEQSTDFLVTPSRKLVRQQLDDLLALREFRREAATNEAQRYGGLGGIVIEGESGIGKSELVIATLRAHGYEEVHDYQNLANKKLPEKPFYRMPVSMQIEDKKRLLLTACREGAVVVIDEINSSPMMESLLNDLLMGKIPDDPSITIADGKRVNKPGFLVIGTQNPITMEGRRKPSTALARRLITTLLPSYSHDEMKSILIKKGINEENASLMVTSYENNVNKARQEHLSPAPTFRDLIRLAERVLKTQMAGHSIEDIISNQEIELSQKTPKEFTDLQSRLIQNINLYSAWRLDKSMDDNRGYPNGFFTRLRHWTKFGEERASALLTNLNNCHDIDDIKNSLRDHLSHHSRLNNHSLDTYLLEVLKDFPDLFDIRNVVNLNTKEERKNFLEEIMPSLENSRLTIK